MTAIAALREDGTDVVFKIIRSFVSEDRAEISVAQSASLATVAIPTMISA